MPVLPPPPVIVSAVERFRPGFWFAFQRKANRALASAGGPFIVTSRYRSPSENARVRGAQFSQHLIGAAFDVDAANPDALTEALQLEGFWVDDEGDHLHAQAWNPEVWLRLIGGV